MINNKQRKTRLNYIGRQFLQRHCYREIDLISDSLLGAESEIRLNIKYDSIYRMHL